MNPIIPEILWEGAIRGMQKAIEIASRVNTSLILQKGDKILDVKPKYKSVRAPMKKLPLS